MSRVSSYEQFIFTYKKKECLKEIYLLFLLLTIRYKPQRKTIDITVASLFIQSCFLFPISVTTTAILLSHVCVQISPRCVYSRRRNCRVSNTYPQ